MNKKQIVILVICLAVNISLVSCVTTNQPHDIRINNNPEPIIVYQKYFSHGYINYHKRELIPEKAMQISFMYSHFDFIPNRLSIYARLFLTKQYEKLYIKEISYIYNNKNYQLIKDKEYNIPAIKENDMLFIDEGDDPVIINGGNYYWISVDLNDKGKHPFIYGSRGQENEIEIIQIYSFDEEPLREERYKYKIICGGTKIEFMRLILWMFM